MELLKRSEIFTEEYKRVSSLPPGKREAALLAVQYPDNMDPLRPGDLLAGRESTRPFVGFHPEPQGGEGLGLYCHRQNLEALLGNDDLSDGDRLRIRKLLDYWKDKSVHALIRSSFDKEMKDMWPSDDFAHDDSASFPLYRLALVNLDFERLVTRGLPGLREDVITRRQSSGTVKSGNSSFYSKSQSEEEFQDFMDGLEGVLDVLESVLIGYRDEAGKMAARKDLSAIQREQASDLALSLESLRNNPPRTLREALQLAWITGVCAGAWNWGRVDDWAGTFLHGDLKAGILTWETGKDLVKGFYSLIRDRSNVFNNRVILGGRGQKNPETSDLFARLAMEAFDEDPHVEPQLTWRFHRDSSPDLHALALDLIGRGRSFPLLYNDDAVIPGVAAAFDIGEEEARCYSPQGCGEYVVGYSGTGTPNGIINLTKCLEAALNGGRSTVTDRMLGPAAKPVSTMNSFEELWKAYTEQVEYHVNLLARYQDMSLRIAGDNGSFLLTSLLTDDCLQQGKPLLSGGARRVGCSLEVYGEVNGADSLLALKQAVFHDRSVNINDLVRHMGDDFSSVEGETIRRELLALPKFGNDRDDADAMAARVHDHSCLAIRNSAASVDMDYHLAVIINNSVNSLWGRSTGASADGRKKGEALANGINPAPGRDQSGLPAFLNSLLVPRVDHHAGAVQNIKLSPELFREHRDTVNAFLNHWFERGAPQAMISVVNGEDLQDAYDHPEKWPQLIVRVGGFSARFVTLERTVQKEILGRTLYGF